MNVFNKLNVQRNIVEHEYVAPQPDQVEDALDVCHLLLLAMDSLGQGIPYEGVVGMRPEGEHALIRLEAAAGEFQFFRLEGLETSFFEDFGIEYISTTLAGGALSAISQAVNSEPMKTVQIRRNNLDDWRPYLRVIVDFRKITRASL
jgi:hypothetical protein